MIDPTTPSILSSPHTSTVHTLLIYPLNTPDQRTLSISPLNILPRPLVLLIITGDYLQFTMLKENVDTMSAAGIISRNLRLKPDAIKYAGTKDKRAITSQKCTVYRRKPSDLGRINRFNIPPFIRVGDFEYVHQPLKLGIHSHTLSTPTHSINIHCQLYIYPFSTIASSIS